VPTSPNYLPSPNCLQPSLRLSFFPPFTTLTRLLLRSILQRFCSKLPSSLAFLSASVRLHALATSALQGAERISRSYHPSSTLLFSLVSPDYIARLNWFPSPSTPCVDAHVLSEALIYDRHNFLLFGWVLRPRRWPPPGLLLPRKPAAFLPLTSASLSIQSDPARPSSLTSSPIPVPSSKPTEGYSSSRLGHFGFADICWTPPTALTSPRVRLNHCDTSCRHYTESSF
jgi:hypothetical protein